MIIIRFLLCGIVLTIGILAVRELVKKAKKVANKRKDDLNKLDT